MTKVRTGEGVSKFLSAKGFSPVVGCPKKIAGVIAEWQNEQGQKALVGYELYTRSGQSSVGSAARWGYTATFR